MIPLCSIVMATRDKADILDTTLTSIRNQFVPFPYELIVVDDGSTDYTHSVCKKHKTEYHFLNNPRYRNPSVARNVGYKAARGKIIIAQSDDVQHISPNTVEYLTKNLAEGEFLLAQVKNFKYVDGEPQQFILDYCSPKRQMPYFFLGALWKSDLYAIGGNDEEFVEPCFDDNWFSDCLIHGLGLTPIWTDRVEGYHQSHDHLATSHRNEDASRQLYREKLAKANQTKIYISSGGPWKMEKEHLSMIDATKTIPKRMSFFWASTSLSWLRFLTLKSFRHYHPDWEVYLYWTKPDGKKTWVSSEVQDSEVYKGPDYTERLENLGVKVVDWEPPKPGLAPAHASDICEWEILGGEGGFYSDMDVLWVKPIDYDSLCSSDVVYCLTEGYAAIGFFGATPDNPFFQSAYDLALENYKPGRYQTTGAEAIYRAGGLPVPGWNKIHRPGDVCFRKFRKEYKDLSFRELAQEFLYPYYYVRVAKIFKEDHTLPEETTGIHWFGGSEVGQTFNLEATEENLQKFPCTFTRYAIPLYDSK